ncbi:SusC/RagA family TonB-linked outer membrane protein [Sphingobacterium sp. DR205]|uniref:SusC/RagA family TonB-linked outer membrane protein n=1 Tax=Sphingobacterium sp. DR205 TaxID=2713573 RepID=UPI0013E4BB70|nr:SusC/RagA family TonB-linked outer membrane protein [Sphingobacterium sp. DR205]QIH35629.1 SusC/RagA family TonB-linked outer membrane protein [Sphingobacterium sp. DR205]
MKIPNYNSKGNNNTLKKIALMLSVGLLIPVSLLAQNRQITGTVVDAKTGEPLSGVSVKIEKTNIGTQTNASGGFSITIPQNTNLVVSYVGYNNQVVKMGNGGTYEVKMDAGTSSLEEVVVVGYGTMRKKDLTGSVVQVKPDNLANENPKTVQDILRGTPGLSVGYDASAKGGGSMQLRGQRSVYTDGGHNDPLIVLDGMVFFGELSEINPDDIGQIDILKDASAAAVYGSRAASGVIIITTKKGRQGKPVVNLTANIGTTIKSAYREVFSPDAYMKYREDWYKKDTYGTNLTTGKYEAYQSAAMLAKPGYYENPDNLSKYGITLDQWRAYTGNTSGESDRSIYAKRLGLEGGVLTNYLAGNTFDWYNHTFRTGFNQDYNTSISGANDRMNYYMSMGYLRNEGAVDFNNYKAIRSNLKLEGKVNRWLEIGANVNFQDRSDGDLQPGLGLNYWDSNQVRNSPFSHYRNADGSLAQYPMGDGSIKRGVNADFDRQYLDLEKGYTVLNTIFNAKVNLPFNITYSFNAAPRYQWYYNRYFMSSSLPESLPVNRGVDRGWSKNFDWMLNNTINWEHTFAERHRVNLTLVQEAEDHRYWSDVTNARNILPSDALGFHNTQNATKENSSFSTNDTHFTADGLLARVFYAYDDKYMLTASVRRDGYSAFGQNNPYAVFPMVAGSWVFTKEKFFKWNAMSSGKLRVSWGKNGNRSLGDPYVSLANLGSGLGSTMGYIVGSGMEEVKYLLVDRMANPGLQWEKTAATNIGLDFGFLNERLSGTLEFYSMTTHDMIMARTLPQFTGFGSITTNLGEVQNKGFEVSLSSLNVKKDNFEWRSSVSFSYNKNKIKHLYYDYQDVLDANGNVTGQKEYDVTANNWFIGQPISTIWNYRVSGIWQADEATEAARYGQRPGDPKVANIYTADDKVNSDGTITPVYNDKDKEFLGQAAPPINWQLRNDFTLFKNWNLSLNIYSYMGHKSLDGNYLNQDNGGSMITYNFNTFAKEYWTPENPTNKYARLDAMAPAGASAGKLYNRSFIRLENISLGYTLPKLLTKKWEIERVKVFGSVRNVATWQKDWEYGDPETGGLATRIFSFGLNLTF